MASQITIATSQLSSVLDDMLDSFSAQSIEKMKKATADAAKFGRKDVTEIAQTIPVGSGDYAHKGLIKSGRYSKSWNYKKVNETSYTIEYNVYSKKYYMLTHLLEFGHEKFLFGRATGQRVRGYPHISVAQKHTADKFVQFVVSEMRRYDDL